MTWTRRARIVSGIKYAALAILALVFVVGPFWVVLVNSWKSFGEASRMGLGLPTEWAILENYREVFEKASVPDGLRNSLIVASTSITALVLLGAAAAWVFARSTRRLDRVAYYLVVLGIFIPPAVVTTIALLRTVGLYGGHAGLVTFYLGAFLPLTIFLMAGFIRTIPMELEDAARIDGCGHLGVFVRIVLPLLRPVIATSVVLLMILIWNEFFWAFFALKGTANNTLPLGLYYVQSQSQYEIRWNLVFTHIVIVSVPLLVVFVIAQRRIMSGLTGGALKG